MIVRRHATNEEPAGSAGLHKLYSSGEHQRATRRSLRANSGIKTKRFPRSNERRMPATTSVIAGSSPIGAKSDVSRALRSNGAKRNDALLTGTATTVV